MPDDLKVKFEEVTIDRGLVHIRVDGKSYETADRLVAELAREAPFENTKIDGEVSKKPKGEGVIFNVRIALELPGDES